MSMEQAGIGSSRRYMPYRMIQKLKEQMKKSYKRGEQIKKIADQKQQLEAQQAEELLQQQLFLAQANKNSKI